MAENSLIAKIIPILDMAKMTDFVSKFSDTISEGLSNVDIKASVSSSTDTSTTSSTSTSDRMTQEQIISQTVNNINSSAQSTDTNKSDNELLTNISSDTSAVVDTIERIDAKDRTDKAKDDKDSSDNAEEQKSFFAKTKESLTELLANSKSRITTDFQNGKLFGNMASAMVKIPAGIAGAGALVSGAILGIVKLLRKSSPVLDDICSLIESAFGMILEPIGIILAQELAPIVSSLYKQIGEWFGEAREIYDQSGWVGLIANALKIGWTMFLEIASTAFAILWDGFQNVPVIGSLFMVVYKIFDFLGSNLTTVLEVIKIYLSTLVGLKVAEATTGIFGDVLPGLNLLLGAGAGVATYAIVDAVTEDIGLDDLAEEIEEVYGEFKETMKTTSSGYSNSYTSTVSTSGSQTYSSSSTASTGNTYNNYFSFNGYNTDEMVKTIQTEVSRNVNMSRSYLGV